MQMRFSTILLIMSFQDVGTRAQLFRVLLAEISISVHSTDKLTRVITKIVALAVIGKVR